MKNSIYEERMIGRTEKKNLSISNWEKKEFKRLAIYIKVDGVSPTAYIENWIWEQLPNHLHRKLVLVGCKQTKRKLIAEKPHKKLKITTSLLQLSHWLWCKEEEHIHFLGKERRFQLIIFLSWTTIPEKQMKENGKERRQQRSVNYLLLQEDSTRTMEETQINQV